MIAKKYYVVLYMGDNAGDFPIGTKGKDLSLKRKCYHR